MLCMIMARSNKLYSASKVGQTTRRLFLSYPGGESINRALGSRISVLRERRSRRLTPAPSSV